GPSATAQPAEEGRSPSGVPGGPLQGARPHVYPPHPPLQVQVTPAPSPQPPAPSPRVCCLPAFRGPLPAAPRCSPPPKLRTRDSSWQTTQPPWEGQAPPPPPAAGEPALPALPSGSPTAGIAAPAKVLPPGRARPGVAVPSRGGRSARGQTPAGRAGRPRAVPARPPRSPRAPGSSRPHPHARRGPRGPSARTHPRRAAGARSRREPWRGGRPGGDTLSGRAASAPAGAPAAAPPAGPEVPLRAPPRPHSRGPAPARPAPPPPLGPAPPPSARAASPTSARRWPGVTGARPPPCPRLGPAARTSPGPGAPSSPPAGLAQPAALPRSIPEDQAQVESALNLRAPGGRAELGVGFPLPRLSRPGGRSALATPPRGAATVAGPPGARRLRGGAARAADPAVAWQRDAAPPLAASHPPQRGSPGACRSRAPESARRPRSPPPPRGPRRGPATTTAWTRTCPSGSTTRRGSGATGPRSLSPCTGPVTKLTGAGPPPCMRCRKYFIQIQVSFPDNLQQVECSGTTLSMSTWRRAS
uniref:Uncharacterized protein n=1 Tax=Canis lupus familiaris TaxID=9615 RepID=A0A8C0NX55_CANLF